ncbi:AraC family transcriptional regulator [Erysipelothrix rhusiopathiae SY1027]|uniref:helix-turn-helix transcriptional regulator n=1 Tax=Erysipelothrix rhusiopathiae TaxID=1648 RepID=UPI0003348B66|nr:helix-turn-helix transcriptional regulator [Erysipelothrix rhusiopathiae]AGN24442.1 AraC family transcriptional regulator [Erysipelothrix rhusiopathiae SY1027]
MYQKTTGPQFLKYGHATDKVSLYPIISKILANKKPNALTAVSEATYIRVVEGIAVILVEDADGNRERFVIHRTAVIHPHIRYALMPITQSAMVEISYQTEGQPTMIETNLESEIEYVSIKPQFSVSEIYSYYYNVKGKNYHFEGEAHNYWELTYVDAGVLTTEIEGTSFTLENQEMILYFPGQFHTQSVLGENACSYLTIMFDMNMLPQSIEHIQNRVMSCGNELYTLMNHFIRQSTILEQEQSPFAKDLMVSYLQEIMILLFQYDEPSSSHNTSNPIQVNFENEMMDEIYTYIQANIHRPLSVEDICNQFAISRSALQLLFNKYFDMPPQTIY